MSGKGVSMSGVDCLINLLRAFRRKTSIASVLSEHLLDEAHFLAYSMSLNQMPERGVAMDVIGRLEHARAKVAEVGGIICQNDTEFMSDLWTRASLSLASHKCLNADFAESLACSYLMGLIFVLGIPYLTETAGEIEQKLISND